MIELKMIDKAFEDCISDWWDRQEYADTTIEECALCQLFFGEGMGCEDCPLEYAGNSHNCGCMVMAETLANHKGWQWYEDMDDGDNHKVHSSAMALMLEREHKKWKKEYNFETEVTNAKAPTRKARSV